MIIDLLELALLSEIKPQGLQMIPEGDFDGAVMLDLSNDIVPPINFKTICRIYPYVYHEAYWPLTSDIFNDSSDVITVPVMDNNSVDISKNNAPFTYSVSTNHLTTNINKGTSFTIYFNFKLDKLPTDYTLFTAIDYTEMWYNHTTRTTRFRCAVTYSWPTFTTPLDYFTLGTDYSIIMAGSTNAADRGFQVFIDGVSVYNGALNASQSFLVSAEPRSKIGTTDMKFDQYRILNKRVTSEEALEMHQRLKRQ